MENGSHHSSDAITAFQHVCGVTAAESPSRDEGVERLVEQILIESGIPSGRRNLPQFGTASMTLLSLGAAMAAMMLIFGLPFLWIFLAFGWRLIVYAAMPLLILAAILGAIAVFVNEDDSSERMFGSLGFVLGVFIATWALTVVF